MKKREKKGIKEKSQKKREKRKIEKVRLDTENHNKMVFFEVLHVMRRLIFHFTALKPLIFQNTGIFVATLGTCEGLLTFMYNSHMGT